MVLELSKIPLILKTIDSVENAMYLIDDFCSEMKNSNGLIIIDGGEDDFSKIQHRQNIIVKIVWRCQKIYILLIIFATL